MTDSAGPLNGLSPVAESEQPASASDSATSEGDAVRTNLCIGDREEVKGSGTSVAKVSDRRDHHAEGPPGDER